MGESFVLTSAVLIHCAVLASGLPLWATVRQAHRQHGFGPARTLDLMEGAFLIGGPARAVDTALVSLQQDGRISIGGPGVVVVHNSATRDAVERAVLHEYETAPDGSLAALRHAAIRNPAVQEIGDSLAARGLLLPPAQSRRWSGWGGFQAAMCMPALLFALAVTAMQLGRSRSGSPFVDYVPFILLVLPALGFGLVSGILWSLRAKRRVTDPGQESLRAYRADPANALTLAQQVALGGFRVLTDPVLRAHFLTAARHRPSHNPTMPYVPVPVMVWCASNAPGGGNPGAGCSGSSGGGGGCSGGGGGCSGGGGGGCSGGGGGSSCSGGGGGGGGGSSCGGGGGGGGSSCGGGGGGGSSF
ncbi:hypothetical protein GCM10010329_26330 [Streptomyces spiroverticillatus]|uniref:TIGR04222 domain-containing membrane protein n=1 Tax=Streptomyces finlayi TaxID=67296 RepID=A0A918WVG1_9ACTN|nr:TIGR04222 domain-containing membrane protein [Streptomyces finlayi]GHA02931.1 hypothetical protein GCM10010329_26330 [Streptomyces spiroverticillatus]GHC87158.1 hypothetical protein GCM10010334_18740 [Streptomyces finlayi]